jgi:hypothetical protein
MLNDFYYSHPTWLDGLLVIGVWTGISLGGLCLFNRFVSVHKREKDNESVGLTYAIVAVIFAVLVAVIIVDVWETAAKADEIATAEANQLSSLVLDSAGLQPEMAQAVQRRVDKYIDTVSKTEWPAQQAGKQTDKTYERGWKILAHMSSELAVFEPKTMGENATKAQMLKSVNELIKARRVRILAAADHLPDVIWLILILAGMISVFYTYLFGAHSFWIHLWITGLIASTIALVFVLIIALDFPFRGDVSVSDDAFLGVRATAGVAAPPAPTPKPAPTAAPPPAHAAAAAAH